MRRVICTAHGDPVRLSVVEEATPVPGPGEVVVEVAAASATFVDGLIARGLYQVLPTLPYTPGMAVAGRVAVVGDGVSDCDAAKVGVPVVALMMGHGGFASHVLLPAEALVPVPDTVNLAVAASAVENYSTVVFAVTRRVAIAPGENVVVLGAGGAIGLAAVDVAHGLGAVVVAVASSEEKRAAARAAGADVAIDYADLKNSIRAQTNGGADVVLDPVGGEASEAALRGLAAGGRLCVIGFASGEIPKLPANFVLLRNRSVIGVDWGDWARAEGAGPASRDLLADVLARASRGEIHPPAPHQAALDDAEITLGRFADRKAAGSYVLLP